MLAHALTHLCVHHQKTPSQELCVCSLDNNRYKLALSANLFILVTFNQKIDNKLIVTHMQCLLHMIETMKTQLFVDLFKMADRYDEQFDGIKVLVIPHLRMIKLL